MKREKNIQQVLWITLGFNVLVSVTKIITGHLGNITSVLADGYHSLADASSNIVGLIGMSIAKKPIDYDHAYGHQRYETLATLFIVVLLTLLAGQVSFSALTSLLDPSTIKFERSFIPIVIMMTTLIINLSVATYQRYMGNKLQSSFLKADAKHTLSDVFVNVGVLVNLLLITLLNAPFWLDSITSLLIALFIFKTAISIFNESAQELTDAIALDPQDIISIVIAHPQVLSIHKVRSRKSGKLIFVDFHIQCDPSMSLIEAHTLSHDLQLQLKTELNPDISCIVHVEPLGHSYTKES